MKSMHLSSFLVAGAVLATVGCSSTMAQQSSAPHASASVQTSAETAPPPADFKKVSSLVQLPDFLPGLGSLYVVPSTLPAGPFLAYDRSGKLVSTVYMVPVKDIDAHKKFADLNVAHQPVDHVDMYYNAGHPGVPEPHYHVILWYISPAQVAALK